MNDAEILEVIREAVAFAVPEMAGRELKSDQTIGELGISSIAVLEIVGYIEDKTGMRFPDDELAQLNTIGELATLIRAHSQDPSEALRRTTT